MVSTDESAVPSYSDLLRLDDKAFMVVGAGQGIGRQVSHALVQQGAKILCCDVEEARAAEIAEETGGVPWHGDATDRTDVQRMVADAVGNFGRLDGFVDIIGMATFLPFFEITDELWELDQRLCIRHAYLVSQEAGKYMVDHGGGSMVYVASISGIYGAPRHSAYGAAKAGLINLTRSLADELGPKGVRVNAVSPGGVLTPRMLASLPQDQIERSSKLSPLGRMAYPQDIASAALFLSTPLAAFVTGQVLPVDGYVGGRYPFYTEEL